ncbi:TPA: hypothetical protein HA238_06520 [Candidatus Micrarchaeota archaeon]|nr:hypothetical protein [Candidatus Micrarchaeota archaeon]
MMVMRMMRINIISEPGASFKKPPRGHFAIKHITSMLDQPRDEVRRQAIKTVIDIIRRSGDSSEIKVLLQYALSEDRPIDVRQRIGNFVVSDYIAFRQASKTGIV